MAFDNVRSVDGDDEEKEDEDKKEANDGDEDAESDDRTGTGRRRDLFDDDGGVERYVRTDTLRTRYR